MGGKKKAKAEKEFGLSVQSEMILDSVSFCDMAMDRLVTHVAEREGLTNSPVSNARTYMEPWHTKTAIKREITELRAALLELSKMLEV